MRHAPCDGDQTYHKDQIELLDPLPLQGILLFLEYRQSTSCRSVLRHNLFLNKDVVDQAVNNVRPHRCV